MKRGMIRLGTRGSALARAQAGQVARDIANANPGVAIETIVIETSGDRFALEAPQSARAAPTAEQGVKGLFVKEIEEALLERRIDLAVHSAKDLPEQFAPGLVVGAYPKREDPRDVFIGAGAATWASLPARAVIGTSSLRRKLQILAAKPQAAVVPLRGNIDTRLNKISSQNLNGVVLAAAGLIRLGKAELARDPLPLDVMVPSPGQGALALEIRSGDAELGEAIKPLDHPLTRIEVECERAFSAEIGGGCSAPTGALARANGSGVELNVFWSSGENSSARRLFRLCPDAKDARAFALSLAAELKA